MEKLDIKIRTFARDAMDLADRRGWGLGECRYNINEWCLMEIEDCDAIGLDDDSCKENHQEHLKQAKKMGSQVYTLACELEDRGH